MTTECGLFSVMEEFGHVNAIDIPKNESGNSRGFAFVTFRWHEDAVAAMEELEGSVLDSLILHPRWAAPKKEKKTDKKGKGRTKKAASKKTKEAGGG